MSVAERSSGGAVPAAPVSGRLHMIGNAHIDPVWLWRWQEGFQEVKATFRSALDRMKEDPDFLFTSSSAAHYEFVERNDPALFEEVRARVREGRWELQGGWWIQPDCNIPGAESFVRQGLLGQRYFRSRFGVTATAGYNPDSFGHAASLPQVLAKSGMPHYVFMRPGPHEKGLPGRAFWWESDDGSRVLAFRIPFEYCTTGKDLEPHVRTVATELRAPFSDLMCFYGVGNHGGGPTRENLASIHRMAADATLPELEFSTPRRFFEAVRGQDLPFPVVHDELQMHAVGCYAAHSGVKRANRQAEHLLLTAEKVSAAADVLTGLPYPAEELERAWKGVLFNQFHDILAGTSLEVAYDDARDLYGEAMAIGARELNHGLQAISWRARIPFEEGARPLVVFNPHPWASRAPVELEFGKLEPGDTLLDDEDRPVPFQPVRSGATVSGWRRRLSFVADLPPLGYRAYRVVKGRTAEAGPDVDATETTAETASFRLELDPATGAIASLLDKRADQQVFRGLAARGVVVDDRSDTWSHGLRRFEGETGVFADARVRLLERGPVHATLRSEARYGSSSLRQDFRVYRDLDLIEVRVMVDWRERWKLLRLEFPTNLHFPKATYEIPFGSLERPVAGDEQPGQSWVDLEGRVKETHALRGLSLLNDGKHSFSVREHVLAMTVLRSPVYAHHDPFVPKEDEDYAFIDQGIQHFAYSLVPHAGPWEDAGIVRRALELNAPPVAIPESFHEGTLPGSLGFLEVEPAGVVLTALKRHEDSEDLIVRAYESARRATRATLRFPTLGRVIEIEFGPAEIKTLRVPRDPARPWTEVNLIEWEEE